MTTVRETNIEKDDTASIQKPFITTERNHINTSKSSKNLSLSYCCLSLRVKTGEQPPCDKEFKI